MLDDWFECADVLKTPVSGDFVAWALHGRRHSCWCGAPFLTASKLERHWLVHSGERKWTCFCGRKYSQKSTLDAHVRKWHGGYLAFPERPSK